MLNFQTARNKRKQKETKGTVPVVSCCIKDECFGCQEFQSMAPNEFHKNHLLKNTTTKEVKV